ncbi:hypothetical protein [Streptomyces sp. NPDC056663]|uniref:hypothetical protein n=1 Tax=Streptomyces sp. NPDC056663 TaxID=3345899 RepID=UPI00367B4AFD
MNTYAIITAILAVLYGLHRILDQVEPTKGRIIVMIRAFKEVRNEWDGIKRDKGEEKDPAELDGN